MDVSLAGPDLCLKSSIWSNSSAWNSPSEIFAWSAQIFSISFSQSKATFLSNHSRPTPLINQWSSVLQKRLKKASQSIKRDKKRSLKTSKSKKAELRRTGKLSWRSLTISSLRIVICTSCSFQSQDMSTGSVFSFWPSKSGTSKKWINWPRNSSSAEWSKIWTCKSLKTQAFPQNLRSPSPNQRLKTTKLKKST